MVHIKEEIKQEVHPRLVRTALLLILVPLCIVGAYTVVTGEVPELPRWLMGVALGAVWAGAILSVARRRRGTFTPMYIFHVVGFSLFVAPQLAPHWWRGVVTPEAVQTMGAAFLVISALSTIVGIGKSRPVQERIPAALSQ